MQTIQVSFGLLQDIRSNIIIAHFCTWPGVKFGKRDVCKVRTECSVPHVTPVISDGPALRLSDESNQVIKG